MAEPSWDKYFYDIALKVAAKSKDESPVGAVIVRPQGHIILATGFNGPARGVLDLPQRIGSTKEEKYRWVCHAETNAMYNAARIGVAIEGAHLYVTKFPCVACASALAQSGMRRVYTLDDEPWQNDPFDDGSGTRTFAVLRETGVAIHGPKLVLHLGASRWVAANGTRDRKGRESGRARVAFIRRRRGRDRRRAGR